MKVIKVVFTIFLSLFVTQVFAAPAPSSAASTAAASATPAPTTTTSATATGPDLSGKYTCSGADSNGANTYTSPLQVTKHGSNFLFQWQDNDTGFPTELGMAITNPNVSNAVAIVFKDAKDPKNIAIMFYQIKPDGSFVGNWAYLGDKTIGSEHCTKSS